MEKIVVLQTYFKVVLCCWSLYISCLVFVGYCRQDGRSTAPQGAAGAWELDISLTPRFIEGSCSKLNRLTVSTVSRVSTNQSHCSEPFRLFTVEKPLKRLVGLGLLQPLDKSRG
jgi:hypothetical protein